MPSQFFCLIENAVRQECSEALFIQVRPDHNCADMITTSITAATSRRHMKAGMGGGGGEEGGRDDASMG